MCGIAGFIRTCAPQADERTLLRMGDAIAHRGPDAHGEFMDEWTGLAHRRLSILDLSPQGNQPMVSADGRLVIVFNGEIYNFLELRTGLEKAGHVFRTRTDTEVLLALYQAKGSDCLKDLVGMFAFAVWDRDRKTLFLARDRIGKKPLYYWHGGSDRLAFASEIKALLQLPGVGREIEPTAVADYLKYLYIPAPKTIFKGIHKLPPGHCLELELGCEPRVSEYWDVDFSRTFDGSFEDAMEGLLDLLARSTSCRTVADVPLGAFLSGGIDSSAVVALMAASGETVKTCSIGFEDRRHDEAPYAREVSDLFRTDHAEYYIRENLAETVTLLPKYFDEPFADSSAVPTFHVSRLARRAVTVALSGDGGDESFGGYGKYTIDRWENHLRRTAPRPLLRMLNAAARGENTLFRRMRTLTAGALSDAGRAFYATNTFIGDGELSALLSEGRRKETAGYDPAEHTVRCWDRVRGADHLTGMLYTDLKTYLPGDILVKVDRMSMAHSLEVRSPLLDHRVIEYAAALPSSWKIRGGNKKFILKKSFARILPDHILNRRKHGFTVPLDAWFRKELRPVAEGVLLGNGRMGEYFSLPFVRRIWEEHQSGRAGHGTLLWSLLSFALWHREYMEETLDKPLPVAGNA